MQAMHGVGQPAGSQILSCMQSMQATQAQDASMTLASHPADPHCASGLRLDMQPLQIGAWGAPVVGQRPPLVHLVAAGCAVRAAQSNNKARLFHKGTVDITRLVLGDSLLPLPFWQLLPLLGRQSEQGVALIPLSMHPCSLQLRHALLDEHVER